MLKRVSFAIFLPNVTSTAVFLAARFVIVTFGGDAGHEPLILVGRVSECVRVFPSVLSSAVILFHLCNLVIIYTLSAVPRPRLNIGLRFYKLLNLNCFRFSLRFYRHSISHHCP